MAKKKNPAGELVGGALKPETKHAVIAVACLALMLFFLLAAAGRAGAAGESIFAALSRLFGAGYLAIPLVLLFLAISFFRSIRPNFILYRLLSALVFFVACLSLISLASSGPESWLQGGWLGTLLARPIQHLLGLYGIVFLLAVMLACLFIIFDTRPSLARLSALRRWSKQRNEVNAENNTGRTAEKLNEQSVSLATPVVTAVTSASDGEEKLEKNLDKNKKTKTEDAEFSLVSSQKRFAPRTYLPPPLSLLEADSGRPGAGDIKGNANIIKRTLQNFGIVVEMDEVSIGPSITRYAFKPAEGVKLSRIVALQNDLSLALAAHPLRIEAPIPGKSLVGIEIPNSQKSTVGLASLLGSVEFTGSPQPLLVSLGRGITGTGHFANLARAPHALVAGATGSGKSVVIHTFITSLLYRNPPELLRFIMIDPKRVELTLYNKIPHLLTPVITEAKKAIFALKWAIKEMERRYNVLESHAVRDIASYHKNFAAPTGDKIKSEPAEKLPYIVIIIDELADIMTTYPRELESAIVRLAQMSRAVGIHLILSTQRPSVDVITGLIKANIPTRVALQVSSQIDSRTILDAAGAEKLLGAGDMLYLAGDMGKPVRLQSAFVSESEVKAVADWLAKHYADSETSEINLTATEPNALFAADLNDDDDENGDELYEQARLEVIRAGKASASYLQRKLKVGYARAARLLDILEERGVIGPGDGAKQREVYQTVTGATDSADDNEAISAYPTDESATQTKN